MSKDAQKQIVSGLNDLLALEASVNNLVASFAGISTKQQQNAEIQVVLEKQRELKQAVETCFDTLHIQNSKQFHILKGLLLELTRTILCARDIKINIHKHTIGVFFE